jgi:hypothetical protein
VSTATGIRTRTGHIGMRWNAVFIGFSGGLNLHEFQKLVYERSTNVCSGPLPNALSISSASRSPGM